MVAPAPFKKIFSQNKTLLHSHANERHQKSTKSIPKIEDRSSLLSRRYAKDTMRS